MKKIIYYITLIFITTMILLSIYGAFLGTDRAHDFFTSLPLAIYWFSMIFLTIAAIFSFRKLFQPSLFLIHIGTILILLGSVISCEKGHLIRSQIFGYSKPFKSQMVIYQGKSSNELHQQSENKIWQLPFKIHLREFIVENYKPYLMVNFTDGQTKKMFAELNSELLLNGVISKIRVVKIFNNFKVIFEDDKAVSIDSSQPGRNPAVELEITHRDGSVASRTVFELFQGHIPDEHGYHITYHRPIKDYISKIDIVKNDTVIKSADIEVNRPLHFSGFHFYQHSYDNEQHQYTVLQVVSDTGLFFVYIGYAAMCIGIIWYFWFTKLRSG